MTEDGLRKEIVNQAKSWVGRKETDGTHRVIIDVYNSIHPLPRNYRMSYTDPWCAAFVSACAQVWGMTRIVFPECSCPKMIEKYKAAGRWMEDDAYVPRPADVIFYDWNDDGQGDNTGVSDHVGLVVGVEGKRITIIEGNCSKAVCYQYRQVDGKYIRGYGLPDYASLADGEADEPEPDPEPAPQPARYSIDVPLLQKGDKGSYVQAAQILLILRGCDVGPDGADGDFGNNTQSAVYKFQGKKGLSYDGIIGPATWSALLRG